MHDQLKHDLVHEQWAKLERMKTRAQALERLSGKSKQNKQKTGGTYSIESGLKRPYGGIKSVTKTTSRMQKLFPTTRILHILRDPEGAISSQMRRKRGFKACVNSYFDQVPQVMRYVSTFPDSMFVSFDYLASHPEEELARIFRWMGSPTSAEHIHKVLHTRDPWVCNGRVMPGLRYFDEIKEEPHKSVLSGDQRSEVAKRIVSTNWASLLEASLPGGAE